MKTKPEIEAPAKPVTYRLMVGRDQMSGFDGLSDGDRFADTTGNLWILCPYNGGWGLRPSLPDGKPDYSQAPHPGFLGLDYTNFVAKINLLANT